MNFFFKDEEDFELNWLIDRNIQVGFLAVDSTNRPTPKVERDVFWNDPDAEIPYTEATANLQHDPYMGSAAPVRYETLVALF